MLISISTIIMLVLLVFNIPVYLALAIACSIYFTFGDANILIMVQRMMGGIQRTTLLAIPFFIMAGVCMNYTGITRRMMIFAERLTGHLPGGLGQVNVLLSTLMGGLSGSCVADAAMQSKIVYPEMIKRNYGRGFSAAVTAASSLITPIIPPGLTLITFSLVANVSVGRMFIAGIVPGLIMCITQMIIVHFVSKKRGYKPMFEKRATIQEIGESARGTILALLMPFIIIGGIRSGIFTATETGAICVLYAVLLGALVYKEFSWKHFILALEETALISLSILLIFGSASAFGWIVANERLSVTLADLILKVVSQPWEFMILTVVVLIIIGMFMEGGAVTIILVPLLMPIINELHIDPIYFGIIYVITIVIGTVTPPVGTVMYTVCNITKVSTREFLVDMVPFYLGFCIDLLFFILTPNLMVWLPNLIYGG